MSVIIRLQNLPWNASALDIRRFFHGLSIPDGGVHIIGGDKGDAFIAFSTDEDARQGMLLTGERLNDVPVKLLLSSKTEMQNVIASARIDPVNLVKPNEDDFRGSGNPKGRGAGFSDMAGLRNPGSVLSSQPQSMAFGGNANLNRNTNLNMNLNRDASFNQSGGFNDQRGTNQGGFNQNQMNSNRSEMNSMGQTGLNKPFGNDFFESNLRGEVNQLGGFNRPGGRLADEENPMIPGRMQGPPAQNKQIKSLFDVPPPDVGSRSGNGRSLDKPISQLGGARMSGGFGRINETFDLDRNLDLSFNRPDNTSREVPRNFDSVNRFSEASNNFGMNDRFNDNMDVDIDRAKFNDFDAPGESGFDRSIDRNFGSVGGRPNSMGSNGGNFGRRDERDMNNGRRDPFGLGRNQLDINDRDEFGHNDEMEGPRRGTGFPSDFGRAEGFGDSDDLRNLRDDIGSSGEFGNGRSFGRHESGRPFGGQQTGRPFDEREQGREFNAREPERLFSGQPPISSLLGQNQENLLWSSEPMNDVLPGRLERGKIPSLMSPNMERSGIGGNRRESHSDWCIHLFNLPLTYNYRDIRRMFSRCEIPKEGLKLVNDQFGERSGEGYIRFENEKSFLASLTYNNQMVEGYKLGVESCTKREYNDAVDSYRPLRGGMIKTNPRRSRSPINRKPIDPCILIRRMPLKTTVQDVKKFLGSSLQIKSTGGPFLELNKDNRPTGNAVVEFHRERDYKEALLLDGRTLGGSVVHVIGIDKIAFTDKSLAARREAEMNAGKDLEKEKKDYTSKAADTKAKDSGVKPSQEETCVLLSGLVYGTTNDNIAEFFKGMKIVRDGIFIVCDRNNKPQGTGYVQFASVADRKRALAKNKHFMGKRYVNVVETTLKQMSDKMKAAKDRRVGGNVEVIVLSEDEGNDNSKIEHTVRMQNLHSDCQLEDIMDFFRGLHPIVDSIKLQYKDGKPTGDGLVSFQTSRESAKAISDFNRRSMLGRAVTLSAWPKK